MIGRSLTVMSFEYNHLATYSAATHPTDRDWSSCLRMQIANAKQISLHSSSLDRREREGEKEREREKERVSINELIKESMYCVFIFLLVIILSSSFNNHFMSH